MENKFWLSDDYILGRDDGREDMKREIIALLRDAMKATCDPGGLAEDGVKAVITLIEREANV